MKQKMTITVGPNGDVTIDAGGFTGGQCEQEAKKLMSSRITVEKSTKKPSYYEKPNTEKVAQ